VQQAVQLPPGLLGGHLLADFLTQELVDPRPQGQRAVGVGLVPATYAPISTSSRTSRGRPSAGAAGQVGALLRRGDRSGHPGDRLEHLDARKVPGGGQLAIQHDVTVQMDRAASAIGSLWSSPSTSTVYNR
jgi:hypothetical protein